MQYSSIFESSALFYKCVPGQIAWTVKSTDVLQAKEVQFNILASPVSWGFDMKVTYYAVWHATYVAILCMQPPVLPVVRLLLRSVVLTKELVKSLVIVWLCLCLTVHLVKITGGDVKLSGKECAGHAEKTQHSILLKISS